MTSPDQQVTFRGRTAADWFGDVSATDPADRRGAIDVLTDGVAAMSALLRRLGGAVRTLPDPADRAALITALGRVGAQAQAAVAAVHAQVKAGVLTDATEEVRSAGLHALTLLGPRARTEVPALVASLRDELPDVRVSAARALGETGAEARDAITALIPLSQYDPDPHVRAEAAVALWRIDRHPARVLPTLIEVLGQPDEVARWVAADCLREIGPIAGHAVPALLAAYALPCRTGLIRVGIRLALDRIDPAAAAALP